MLTRQAIESENRLKELALKEWHEQTGDKPVEVTTTADRVAEYAEHSLYESPLPGVVIRAERIVGKRRLSLSRILSPMTAYGFGLGVEKYVYETVRLMLRELDRAEDAETTTTEENP